MQVPRRSRPLPDRHRSSANWGAPASASELALSARSRSSSSATRQASNHKRQNRQVSPLTLAVLAACMAGGLVAIAHSYEIAETTIATPSEFVWFWFGMFLVALPLIAVIARRRTPPHVRSALIVLYGLVSYAPKLLRSPNGPVYGDEYAHWRAAFNILNTGKLFSPDPLSSIISQYPGLEATTAALVRASGLTIWQAGTVLLIICHATLLIGVAVLAQTLGFDNRTACLVAILYSLNSSFLYFDTEYSYESMAITLAVWALVAFVLAVRSRPGAGRAAWCVLTIAISAGTVATHHLSTLNLVMIMGLISLALSTPWLARTGGWSGTSVTAWSLTLITTVMAGSWFHFVAPGTFSYLSPYLSEGLSELVQVARGGGGARQLFGTSLSPWWEEESAYLVIVFALAMAIVGLFLLRARIRQGSLPRGTSRSITIAFAVFGARGRSHGSACPSWLDRQLCGSSIVPGGVCIDGAERSSEWR